jgi:hypothetical protein
MFHTVADVNNGVDLLLLAFPASMGEHFADLGIAPLTGNPRHKARERLWIVDPFARPGFAESAEVDELHVETPDLLHGAEHVGLETKRKVPGRLATHRRVHGENEPSVTRAARGDGFQAGKEGIDLGAARQWGVERGVLPL